MLPVFVLFAFVRYIYNNKVEEEMFICECLPAHTATGKDISNVIYLYMAEKSHTLKCSDICTCVA
jgi:hypothetical protein